MFASIGKNHRTLKIGIKLDINDNYPLRLYRQLRRLILCFWINYYKNDKITVGFFFQKLILVLLLISICIPNF